MDERDLHFLRRRFSVGKSDRQLFDEVSPGDTVLMYFDGGLNDLLHRASYGSSSGRRRRRWVRAVGRVRKPGPAAHHASDLDSGDYVLTTTLFDPPIETDRSIIKLLRALVPPTDGPFDIHGHVKERYLCRFSRAALARMRDISPRGWPEWITDFLRASPESMSIPQSTLTNSDSTPEGHATAASVSTPQSDRSQLLAGGLGPSTQAIAEGLNIIAESSELESAEDRTVKRLVATARHTTTNSNGQDVRRTLKIKGFHFAEDEELAAYIRQLFVAQRGRCAISGLDLGLDDREGDVELLCSLDRIDSNGHYAKGNLQLVCRFINRWKNDDDDANFRRLVALLRRGEST